MHWRRRRAALSDSPTGGSGSEAQPSPPCSHLMAPDSHLPTAEGQSGQREVLARPMEAVSAEGLAYLSEPSLSTGTCEIPRLLEKSDLFEETLAKPFPPVTTDPDGSTMGGAQPLSTMPRGCPGEQRHSPGLLSYPAVTAAKVGLPFLPGREAAFVSLCLLLFSCFAFGSLEGRSRSE